MKKRKQKKSNAMSSLIILVAVLSVVLIALFCFVLWLESNNQDVPDGTLPLQTETTETTESTTAPTTPTVLPTETTGPFRPQDLISNTTTIETPYLTLQFPEAFEDILAVVCTPGTPYILEFYTVLEGRSAYRLFDIIFDDGEKGNLGIIETDAGRVSASMVIYSFKPDSSWSTGEIATVHAMQDAANDLMEQLIALRVDKDEEAEGPVLSTETPDPGIADCMSITTPYCNLYYPLAWKDYLQTKESKMDDNYCVEFFGQIGDHESALLFTIIFGGDRGEQMGVILTNENQYITVNILVAELTTEDFLEEEINILYEMQEALNEVLSKIPFIEA